MGRARLRRRSKPGYRHHTSQVLYPGLQRRARRNRNRITRPLTRRVFPRWHARNRRGAGTGRPRTAGLSGARRTATELGPVRKVHERRLCGARYPRSTSRELGDRFRLTHGRTADAGNVSSTPTIPCWADRFLFFGSPVTLASVPAEDVSSSTKSHFRAVC